MKIAICAIIKDEQRYLEEWINHHLKLGFDDIYLYEDFNSTSHQDICSRYEHVFLNSINNFLKTNINDYKRQIKTYRYFIKLFKEKYDWVTFIDIDEYINTEDGINLKSILTSFEQFDGLFIFWKMYNANNLIEPPCDFKIVNNYTTIFESNDPHLCLCKSFVNLKKDIELKSHHAVERGVNTLKSNSRWDISYDKIWINHYYTKSWSEWLVQIFKRGDLWRGHRRLFDFFTINPEMKNKLPELISNMGSLYRKYK